MGSAVLSLPRKYPYTSTPADVYCTLGCSGTVFGYVRYLIGNNVVRIVEIEVASRWRGYGWAGFMLRELKSRYGGVSFECAQFTEDGRRALGEPSMPMLPGEWSFYDFAAHRVRSVPDGLRQ